MPAYNPDKDLKLYYSIGEVSEMYDINATTLRFWEKEFPMIQPRKVGRNIRQYTKQDIEIIGVIYNLVKVRGMKLKAAKEAMIKNPKGAETKSDV